MEKTRTWHRWLLPLLILASTLVRGDEAAYDRGAETDMVLSRIVEPFIGDLVGLRERGLLRVLVAMDRPNLYLAGPVYRGFEYEMLEQFQSFINEQRGKGEVPITLVYLPLPRSELIPALQEGRGDLIVAGLTIDDGLADAVAFSDPYLPDIRTVVVTSTRTEGIERIEQLGGRRVAAIEGSSAARFLRALQQDFASRGIPTFEIDALDGRLQSGDLLRKVDQGEIGIAVLDEHVAAPWRARFPHIRVHQGLAIHEGGALGWAVRPDSPELLGLVNRFVPRIKRGTLLGNVLFNRYFEEALWVSSNPAEEEEGMRLREVAQLLRRHAARYGFDWLAVVAQAFQESRLDQGRVSQAGARGLLQVLPETAVLPEVAIPDIDDLEQNLEAGLKYLRHLIDNHYPEEWVNREERFYFGLAAYNAGPTKIGKLRRMTTQMGKDPGRWFGNVEIAAQDVIGNETVQYVGNIIKYFVAYRYALSLDPEFSELLWAEEKEQLRTQRLRRAFEFTGWVASGLLVLGVFGGGAVWLRRRRECCEGDEDDRGLGLLTMRIW